MLFEEARQKFSQEEFAGFEKIYTFCKKKGARTNLGTGSYGSFSPIFPSLSSKSLFTMSTDKRLAFNFEWTANTDEQLAETFKEKLEAIGYSFPGNFKELRPSVYPDEWLPRVEKFLSAISEMLEGAAS